MRGMMGLSPPDEERIKQANELLQPETEMEEEDEEDMNKLMDDVTKLYKVVAAQENDEDEGEDYDHTEEELARLDRIDKEILRQEERKERARRRRQGADG